MIVSQETKTNHPTRPQTRMVWENKAARPNDMRGDAEQHVAFGKRFAHQAKLQRFQITQAAVNQLGGRRRGSRREIVLFAQINRQPAARGVARNSAAIDATAYDR